MLIYLEENPFYIVLAILKIFLNVIVLFCVSLYPSYVFVTVQFSCYLIIIDNCQNSTFLTGVKTPYTILYIKKTFIKNVLILKKDNKMQVHDFQ